MDKRKVWIDCDTGVDDGAMLLVAHRLEALEILGISAVAGNVELRHTFPNTRRICALMGAGYPVYPGADKPLLRPQITAPHFHGEDGVWGVALPEPQGEELTTPAWTAIHQAALRNPGMELIATGPLTNVAIAIAQYPDLKELLSRILIMGGAVVGGNRTPCAEFNIYADPEAAELVFRSGIPMVMCGLDVTMKAYITPEELDKIAGLNPQGRVFHDLLVHPLATVMAGGARGIAFHDACPVLYAAMPELFETRQAGVYVETAGSITLGKTVCDLESDKKFDSRHTTVVLDVNREKFLEAILSALASY